MSKGIDVSYHQGVIDWGKVKNDGVEYAIIRAGYGKSTKDKQFENNVKGCITHNIPIGVYWFLYCTDVASAIANANKFAAIIEPYKDKITHKVWCDYEYDSDEYSIKKGVKQTNTSRTKIVKVFCNRMKELGYDVGVYANRDYLENKFDSLKEYPLWFARYSETKGNYDCYMWQNSSKGSVDGISGNVDMNILYGLGVKYYNIPEFTLIDSLNKIGVDSSYTNRCRIAKANGIAGYEGTKQQNINLLNLLNQGKLVKA